MREKGNHTWDIFVHYHRCPHCGYITESRKDYESYEKEQKKEITCDRCQNNYTVTKAAQSGFGPLFGKSEHAEIHWGYDQ